PTPDATRATTTPTTGTTTRGRRRAFSSARRRASRIASDESCARGTSRSALRASPCGIRVTSATTRRSVLPASRRRPQAFPTM
ncbi:hypothetical protein AAVH_40197, partial [Aphelenchoides avenae]